MVITEGLPAMGGDIGGAMKGIAPGAGAMILVPGIAYSVAGIPHAIAKGIERRHSKPKRKPSKKKRRPTCKKPIRKKLVRRQSLKLKTKSATSLIPTYKYPKLPKMGPY